MRKFNINGFPNYELIDFGDSEVIVNKKTGKIKKFGKNNKGYISLQLLNNKKKIRVLIHKIKGECYNGVNNGLKGYNSVLTIDHIDDNKCNNNINNLRILTRVENVKRRWE